MAANEKIDPAIRAMSKPELVELLTWITQQDRLRIEVWHHNGGVKTTSVWTISGDEDYPSAKAPTVLEALQQAKGQDDAF